MPMTDTTKTTDPIGGIRKFEWKKEYAAAFTELKACFRAAPILRHFDPTLPCSVETNAIDFAIGAVLSQVYSKKLHPVVFYSRKIDKPEVNYDIHDKEMLAIVSSFKQWCHHLEGAAHMVLVYSDHKNQEYFITSKTLNCRQARWAQEPAAYDF